MNHSAKHILKFGGTSLKNKDFIQQSVRIVSDRCQTARPFIVVSAVADVTDTLLTLVDTSGSEKGKTLTISALKQQHLQLFDQLISNQENRRKQLIELFDELKRTVLRPSQIFTEQKARKDHILSVGERASALIFAAALTDQGVPAKCFTASHFIKTDSSFGQANVLLDTTKNLTRRFLEQTDSVPVVTGFIGSDKNERITTLGRSGSDYTAGLLAYALDADYLEIWSDVNGVLSADPRWVSTAESIDELSFADVNELSAHGASVIHPKTIRPITQKDTSVRVKNSFNPSHPGTLIDKKHRSNGAFRTITITGPFVQIEVEDRWTKDLLNLLNEELENKLGGEAFSYHRSSSFEPVRFIIRQSLFDTVQQSLLDWAKKCNFTLAPTRELYKVKKFSNQFKNNEHITANIWDLLATNNLRPFSVYRNHKERFISFLFDKDEARQAARLLNDYLLQEKTTLDLFVAGTGAVGRTLLNKLKNINPKNLNLRLLGVCNSQQTCWNDKGLPFDIDLTQYESEETNWSTLVNRITANYRHNVIFVDVTGSREVARLYPELLENGVHIATPSKLANSFEQSFFDRIQNTARRNGAIFKYEPNVGAGLPVISTIKHLQQSGDTITRIDGVVSGTMTYLFNQLRKGVPFS